MDNNSSDTSAPTMTSGSTPYPTDSARPGAAPSQADGASDADATSSASAGAKDAVPIVDSLIKRVTQSAHDAVDGLAAKVSSVADGLQGGVDKASDTRDEWLESARDAIRQHPFATVAGALLIGAALLSLRSSRDR